MKRKICVLGLGYIGLPTALLLAQEYTVVGVDVNPNVVDLINNGKLPFKEPEIDQLYNKVKTNFVAKTEVESADVFLIAVPTPLEMSIKVADLKYVRSASEMIQPHLKEGNLVILESTVPPGTSEKLLIPILEKSGTKRGKFSFAHCPERAIPGNTVFEMIHNDRIIGGFDLRSKKLTTEIYSSYVQGNLHLTDIKTAEFVKLIENTFRDVNIALANELAILSSECGIDCWEAIELANKHPRVNILKPGPGVGGHCIAVDPWFLTENATHSRMISLARDINSSMPNFVLKIVDDLVEKTPNPVITIFGVAYKGDVDDTRETPALKLINLAKNEGYTIQIYDPHVRNFEYPLMELKDSVSGSDCIVLLTEHKIFKEIDPEKISIFMRQKNIIDCRNILDLKMWERNGFTTRLLGNYED